MILLSTFLRRSTSFVPPLVSHSLSTPLGRPQRLRSFHRMLSTTNGGQERTPEEMEEIKRQREARKAEKEAAKLAKKAKKAAAEAAKAEAERLMIINNQVTFTDEDSICGDYEVVTSKTSSTRTYTPLPSTKIGSKVWVRGRLQSVRIKGGSVFLVLRQDAFSTMQCVFFKADIPDVNEGGKMIKYMKGLTAESIVDVEGEVVEGNVKSATVRDREIKIKRIHTVSKSAPVLPFELEDAARSQDEVDASQDTDRPFPNLGQELRLDNRWMDLRVPANNAILRVKSGVCQLFRESLYSQGFTEIQTPKLIGGESESGAGVFKTDYFGKEACLAQSPQLYKQMAIASDFQRVFEVGPVFRAENSNTRRHLCEFVGLDLEMAINEHYTEALTVCHNMFKHIFEGLESRYSKEMEVIRSQYFSEPVEFTDEPCILHWKDGIKMIEEAGFDVGDGMQDLTGAQELALGKAVKEKYKTDFFILDQYPSSIRPFYTMPMSSDSRFSNSYDMFIRGQEICSGAQRCHDANMLREIIKGKGLEEGLKEGGGLEKYVKSFENGVSPHAGAGIGLERVVFLALGLDNVRKASMFPRDPNRLTP
eukprot:CAMPEP_0118663576 /NCGR_PEP_ID=MMETSP0785-20121206/17507_1 /TAXON_ID=91992 /ORGANISM="Bolidomonas pacifica, Strain CCMP 1866" /LENGTH=591 /DNA_ID=CAMNT_0006557333 /DNA_START=53 /DNA_END=1828 /DNA_ORIENTATION=-